MAILDSFACVVTSSGIFAPAYSDIYETLQAKFQGIYGSDAYISPDSQDGQLLAIMAKGFADCNDAAVAIYNSMSPATAQGAGLSNNVKINGIARAVPTNGSVTLRLVGQIGATITDGIAADAQGNQWLIPSPTVIPPAGQIDVTATAAQAGAITAAIGTITQIVNPQLGWQSVTNTTVATAGAPIENDSALRQRQTTSVALPSKTVLSGIEGAIAGLAGVTAVLVYENDTDTVDANGLPAHSISAVVVGGVAADIAGAIQKKKTPGCYTNGTTAVGVVDDNGLPATIRYFVCGVTPLALAITIKALSGYTTAIGDQIKAAMVTYINSLGIGQKSDLGKLYLPAQFYGGQGSNTFEVDVMQQAIKPATPTAADVIIPFNSRATLALADIALTVT